MLSNLAETLHSSAKLKNKQAAKIEVSNSKNKDLAPKCVYLPEGLKNTPYNKVKKYTNVSSFDFL